MTIVPEARVHGKPWRRVSATALRVAASLAVLVSACGWPRDQGVPERLEGRWSASFLRADRRGSAEGLIILAATPLSPTACNGDTLACSTLARGRHQISFGSLVGRAVPEKVEGAHASKRDVVIVLGDCCQRGEISLSGTLDDGTLRGTWSEEIPGGGMQGTVVMHRLSDVDPVEIRQKSASPGSP